MTLITVVISHCCILFEIIYLVIFSQRLPFYNLKKKSDTKNILFLRLRFLLQLLFSFKNPSYIKSGRFGRVLQRQILFSVWWCHHVVESQPSLSRAPFRVEYRGYHGRLLSLLSLSRCSLEASTITLP